MRCAATSGAQAQRLQQADATNRVLRDELLGLGQRAALLEDSVSKLADPERHGAQALRLDEVELLLSQGEQRLQLFGDLGGARRAYALAAGVLDGVDDPAYLNLRQALVQERAALDALGADPKALAAGQLDAFVASLRAPSPAFAAGNDATQPWWRRAFARILEVQPSDRAIAVAPGIAPPASPRCTGTGAGACRDRTSRQRRMARRAGAGRPVAATVVGRFADAAPAARAIAGIAGTAARDQPADPGQHLAAIAADPRRALSSSPVQPGRRHANIAQARVVDPAFD